MYVGLFKKHWYTNKKIGQKNRSKIGQTHYSYFCERFQFSLLTVYIIPRILQICFFCTWAQSIRFICFMYTASDLLSIYVTLLKLIFLKIFQRWWDSRNLLISPLRIGSYTCLIVELKLFLLLCCDLAIYKYSFFV